MRGSAFIPCFLLLSLVSVQAYDSFMPAQLQTINANVETAPTTGKEEEFTGAKMNFWSALWAAFVMILATELGDKTFIIAAVLAGKKPRMAIFLGVVITMAFMSIVSSAIGLAFVNFIDKFYLNIAAACLFLLFSILSFKEACSKEESCDDKEIEESILEQGEASRRSSWLWALWQCMGLIFFAEWGDKSQLGTVTLVAQCDPFAVVLGAVIGVMLCTALAVLGGRWIASYLSEKTMGVIAGVIFLAFAVLTVAFSF